ncbi:SAC3 family protein A [Cocos nucifera]|uniref:SAC3 family protein A n=1 Tax=Cocos nucifera TaxID=13894 RepID=A0A8K0I4U0_COCNU|nr:SAC3 family protein A [Cocos nucifera]
MAAASPVRRRIPNPAWSSSGLTESGTPSNSGYHYGQGEMAVSGNAQGGVNSASHASTSTSVVATTATQQYAGYAHYPSATTSYGYSNTQYQSYYYGYQQPDNDSSSQQVGANQNSGAAYQPLSSFQNSAGSYVHPSSYLGTYYNTGDHQTTAGYENSNYNYQNNWWNNGNCGSYPLHVYPSYTSSDTNSTQSSSAVSTNSLPYQQQYNQWPYYYSQSAPIVSCAPGTENTSITIGCSVEGGSGGYPYPSNQPPPPGTTSWRKDAGSSGLPSLQEKKDVTAHHSNGSGGIGAPTFQNHHVNQMPLYFQKPTDLTPLPHENREDQQKLLYSQSPVLSLSSTNQLPENSLSPSQGIPISETRRLSKLQIPTNPRIASNLGMPKTDKESSITNGALKPAYISVSVPKPNIKSSSQDDAEAIIKVTFPPSLRAYVERTFGRCKDDAQRSANQKIMKEIITKASADGTLFTRNWDIEPLFPLPNASLDMVEQKRTKSRWEPVAEENLMDKQPSLTSDSVKVASWDHFEGTGRAADSKKYESKEGGCNGVRLFSSPQQTPLSKFGQRPVKKPRFGDFPNATENGDGSSDSDKEQDLTKYYASAIALANSPEEKRRREHRSKRFEKIQGNKAESKGYGPNIAGAGSIYTRRASAMMLAKNYEDGYSRAVEDIDWDALTVKGTCQEIEKRYLRLTSAPDPATVRTEEVLEKALQMVQTSQKNYFYKCDQLKSIRQDLTVQRIRNVLTVKVYETHARLALEAGDLPEFNQCQSQLKRLYAEGIEGCHMEFSAYNLLCAILHSNSKRDLLSSMTRLSNEAKDDEAVKHALAVRSTVLSGNYVQFFRLYKAAPNLNTCLMDLFVEKMRFEAVKCMSKSYRPTVPVAYVARVLGFARAVSSENSEDKCKDGLVECEEWLRAHGAILTIDNNGELQLDSKASSSSLYIPEPEDAVAHGDASLAVDDFLTRAL